jgi:hypothetical protein
VVEAQAQCIATQKTMQSNYTKFLLDVTKQTDLLADLDPEKASQQGQSITIVLPDFGAIEVVATVAPPVEDEGETAEAERAEDDDAA